MDGVIRALRLDAHDVVLRVFYDSSGIRCSMRRACRVARMAWELVGNWFSGSHEAFVKVGEHRGPCGIVVVSGLFIGKTNVRKAQLWAGFVGMEFDGDDRFYAFGGGREPGQLDQAGRERRRDHSALAG